MRKFTSKKQKIGQLGEQLAVMFLVKHGFTLIEMNFSCRFGEIDIIATKNNRFHFIEVKSITVPRETQINDVSRENMPLTTNKNVSPACRTGRRETFLKENKKLSNPFQNVSYFKIKRLAKTGEIYLIMKHIPSETRWQIDGIGVYLYDETQDHTVEYIPNISIN